MGEIRNCAECHHLPSCRYGTTGLQCFCECHDVADAGPALLAACEEVVAIYLAAKTTVKDDSVGGRLLAAIALARPKGE